MLHFRQSEGTGAGRCAAAEEPWGWGLGSRRRLVCGPSLAGGGSGQIAFFFGTSELSHIGTDMLSFCVCKMMNDSTGICRMDGSEE